MYITLLQAVFAIISGVLVGFSLGLIGGGGSILAIPLLIYFVGIDNPHLVIGTTALAVGINSIINVYSHLRRKNVALKIGSIFTVFGVMGVLVGTTLGLLTPGGKLLFIFSFLMIGIGFYMLLTRCRRANATPDSKSPAEEKINVPKTSFFGLLAGFTSGYFGIGGGFLIVPSLLYSSDLTMTLAVGTSLLSVGTFGIVTAIRYGIAGQVLVPIAILYVIGGVFGGMFGARLSTSMDRSTLRRFFSIIVIAVGVYMAIKYYGTFF